MQANPVFSRSALEAVHLSSTSKNLSCIINKAWTRVLIYLMEIGSIMSGVMLETESRDSEMGVEEAAADSRCAQNRLPEDSMQ
jgi:hypothetical protein